MVEPEGADDDRAGVVGSKAVVGVECGVLLSSEGEVDKRAGVVLGCDVDMCVGTTDAVGWGVEDIIGDDVGEGSVVGIGVGTEDGLTPSVEAGDRIKTNVKTWVEYGSGFVGSVFAEKVMVFAVSNRVGHYRG